MPRLELRLCVCLCLGLATAHADEGTLYRASAPVEFAPGPAFQRLPLPASIYAHSLQADLRDLRLLDGQGRRVPYAILAARTVDAEEHETRRAARLYPLPAAPAGDGAWRMPLEVGIDGQKVTVRQLAAAGEAPRQSAGWLFDLGESRPADPAPHALRLAWRGPSDFSVGYRIETSPDLRAWQAGGSGQLIALSHAGEAISQPLVVLPAEAGRFVRLFWNAPGDAPRLTGAESLYRQSLPGRVDDLTELSLTDSATPPVGAKPSGRTDAAVEQALYFDLGGDLPLARLELRLDTDNLVVPARIEARASRETGWRPVATTVFYRLRRGAESIEAPPLEVATQARWLRLVVDPRAAPLEPGRARLIAQARLPSLVFVAQGPAPYSLLAGSATAAAGALPLATLVPDLEKERPRFGTARLGAWQVNLQAAQLAEAEKSAALRRQVLLWGILVLGVAMLGYMVWRQVRSGR